MSKLARLALFIAFLVALGACGDDGGGSDGGNDAPDEPIQSTDTDTDTGNEADDADEPAGIDIGPIVVGLEVALGGTAEMLDDQTVRMTFDEGSAEGVEYFRPCTVGKALLPAGTVFILAYPDGEKVCD